MPSFDFNKVSSGTNDTPTTISGVFAGLAIQNGNDIQVDKTRYIWRIRALNADPVAAHDLVIWSGDVLALPGSSRRRVLYRTTIPAGGTLDYPTASNPDDPVVRLTPNSTAPAAVQENELYCTDEAGGGLIIGISLSYYDLRA
jgi:hypothetical protein